MVLCVKCGDKKGLTLFYSSNVHKCGTKGVCSECIKSAVRANREKNIDYYRSYDRKRGSRQTYEYVKEYRERFPNKYKAHCVVNNAVRDKKLFKECCEICGNENSVAHHDDYLKPLNVRWLCQAHHKQWHAKNGGGKNP